MGLAQLIQHLVVPTLISHESTADCTVDGHHVPSGTMLLLNVYAIQMDLAISADPTMYRTERFEDGRVEGKLLILGGWTQPCTHTGIVKSWHVVALLLLYCPC